MSIVVKDLNYVYNPKSPFETTALHNVNLTIENGEFVAIVGHTGSGKSTFVQHLNALIRVQSGVLSVNGVNLHDKKCDLKKVRSLVGMVFQYPENQLFADTVAQDVEFGPKNMGMSKDQISKCVQEAVKLVGLDWETVKAKSPFELSGGERRRVALAGVLAMQPKVLVLDEPTAGLDPQGKHEILSLVKKLNEEQGVTVIMVSHDMNEVYENAKRIIVMKEGEVVYDTTPEELFSFEDEIVKMNLEVPYMAQFCNYLRRNHVKLPKGVKTVDQVLKAVNALKGGSNV